MKENTTISQTTPSNLETTMITVIDNNQSVFYVYEQGWGNTNFVCNLKDLRKCINYFEGKEQYKVARIFNNKLEQLYKKEVIELLEANKL
jgi:hypothetical protein